MGASEVCPTEDAIQTLLEYLVDPLLPAKYSVRDNPSESQQQLVAVQVHAVLLLYNYYHRKQHPHLKDGDFAWFCKLVVSSKPALLAYMNSMQKSDDAKSELVEQLSITEKQIVDACDISKGLYALEGVPSTDWPISKVTVFLVDSSRKNCLLQFSSITKGVWSVIENDLYAANQSSDGVITAKKLNKRKKTCKNSPRDELSSNEVDFQQLAFSAVEEATKINQTDLMILEGHVSYSLSREKSATCFYIMQCTLSKYDGIFQVPIKDAIDSLQGPLLLKRCSGWMISPVVEYFHLLPYAGILSDWQSGIVSSNSFYSKVGPGKVNINDYRRTEKPCNIEVQKNPTGETVMTEDTDNMTVSSHTGSPKNEDKNDGFMSYFSDDFDRPDPDHMDVDCSTISANTKARTVKSAMKSPCRSEKVAVPNKVSNKKTSSEVWKHKADSALANHQPKPKDLDKPQTVEVSVKTSDQVRMHKADSALIGHQPNPKDLDKPLAVEVSVKTSDKVRKHKADFVRVNHQPKPKDLDIPQTVKVSVKTSDQVRIHKADSVKTSDQVRIHKADSALIGHQPNPENLDKPHDTEVSKDYILSQAALKLLHRRRDKLTLELRDIEDEIAQCDRYIQRILNGSEDDFALKIESILEGCTDIRSRNCIQERTYEHSEEGIAQYMKRKRLSEAVLRVQNPCQELDGICYENNWILPTYRVSSSDGGFQAKASVKGIDFECSAEGCLRPSPSEARESAAAQILVKLRDMAKSGPTL